MRNPKKGHKVLITTGKHQGESGVITEVITDPATINVLVQIPGLPYERAFLPAELEYKGRIEQVLSTGEARRKRLQALVKEGKVCPSYPHSCNGGCINTVNDKNSGI